MDTKKFRETIELYRKLYNLRTRGSDNNCLIDVRIGYEHWETMKDVPGFGILSAEDTYYHWAGNAVFTRAGILRTTTDEIFNLWTQDTFREILESALSYGAQTIRNHLIKYEDGEPDRSRPKGIF